MRSMRQKDSVQRFSTKKFNDWLFKFVLNVNFSFRFIESFFFKNIVFFLKNDVNISEWTTFEVMIKQRVKEIKKKILKNLKLTTKIFIALNVWINLNHVAFLSVIVYFIDKNWQYRKIFISFKSLSEQHFEEKMINTILKILQRYDLTSRLIIVTANNVNNNQFLRKHLFKRLRFLNVNWNAKTKIMNCMIHVLQLIVIAFLMSLNVQIVNDEVFFKFDEKKLNIIIIFISFENTLKKKKLCLFFLFFLLIIYKFVFWQSLSMHSLNDTRIFMFCKQATIFFPSQWYRTYTRDETVSFLCWRESIICAIS